jgi:hypothetical protein
MTPNRALHFKYWIGILLAAIILIAAAAWGADPKLADKVNFAVGVTSVILALLAIYVTMAFSTLFSNNVVTFLGLNSRIEDSAAKLITATADLNQKLEIIPTGFKDLVQAVQTSSERVDALIAQRTTASTTQPQNVTRTLPFSWTEAELSSFYPALQYLAIVATYLAVHAHRRSRTISDQDLATVSPAINSSYFIAVMGFLAALNLCDFSLEGVFYRVTAVNPLLEGHVDTWIAGIIARARQGMMPGQSGLIESGKAAVDRLMIAQTSPPPPPITSPQSTAQ